MYICVVLLDAEATLWLESRISSISSELSHVHSEHCPWEKECLITPASQCMEDRVSIRGRVLQLPHALETALESLGLNTNTTIQWEVSVS